MTPVIVVHYGELSLKGDNRHWFEDQLLKNIRHALRTYRCTLTTSYGRFIVRGEDVERCHEEIVSILQCVPGIAALLIGVEIPATLKEIEQATLTIAQRHSFKSFAINTHRTDKRFPYNSMELNQRLGSMVVGKTGASVDLTMPDLRIGVMITDQGCYVTWRKVHGREGLPVGSSGKILSLISAGIDSPVASGMMLTRGLQVVYVHFHSYPLTSRASIDIVQQLVARIQHHQPPATVLLAPLHELQQQIVTHAPSSYRVVLYRRAMFAIAEQLARQEQCLGLCTGESVGQVASQTMENMTVATERVRLPILRPLIGMNKSEIMERARVAGTYELSIQPYEDCCSLLVPQRVETRAKLEKVHAAEDALPWKELIASVISGIERKNVV